MKDNILEVKVLESKKLGNCYRSTMVEVQSAIKLSREKLLAMRNLGILGGYGQEFLVHSCYDGSESPSSDGNYLYKVEHRIDSGG